MDGLIGETAAARRAAGECSEATVAAVRRFLDAGMEIVYSPLAVWDFFGSALRRAGFDEQEQDRRTRRIGPGTSTTAPN
jgi:hypothetical protein